MNVLVILLNVWICETSDKFHLFLFHKPTQGVCIIHKECIDRAWFSFNLGRDNSNLCVESVQSIRKECIEGVFWPKRLEGVVREIPRRSVCKYLLQGMHRSKIWISVEENLQRFQISKKGKVPKRGQEKSCKKEEFLIIYKFSSQDPFWRSRFIWDHHILGKLHIG